MSNRIEITVLRRGIARRCVIAIASESNAGKSPAAVKFEPDPGASSAVARSFAS